ncbi:PRC-barrel domain-containing protein [Herbaspirillum sp. SJZ107]|uniref:PRC-barrel domain-containing protein n=1 Tax=Herbaspirillum sp. SJZ107 TaxID=2572881 RepID=UPI00115164A8|nr:PRC-barrel domain-containing protein [Herbaspirillum sp. SJZ107]TQK06715.1 PRC-barrel domain protein [Herbaspirillum sp. SJZ107]
MKRMLAVLTMAAVAPWAGVASAQSPAQPSAQAPAAPVAGRTPLGVTVVEMETIVVGWSAKRDLLGKTVANDKNEKIGKVDDVIISPGKGNSTPAAPFAIIGVGGFLGIGKRDVAIPMDQFKVTNKQLSLPGATKDALKALPPFVYQNK